MKEPEQEQIYGETTLIIVVCLFFGIGFVMGWIARGIL